MAVVFEHEAVADELARGVFGGSEELGGKLLAELGEAEAFVHAQAEEEGLFEGFALEDIDGCGDRFGCVVREVFGVGEADGAVGAKEHGVGVETEAEVGIALPVLAVVARLVRRGREVGDFVLREAVLREVRAGGLVELGGEFVGGNAVGVEALAAGEDFAAEAGVFVDFEHVDAEVGEADAGGDVERVLPGGGGLVGEAGDEVGADVG